MSTEVTDFNVVNLTSNIVKVSLYNSPIVELAPGEKKEYPGNFPTAGVQVYPKDVNSTFRSISLDYNGHPLTLTVM